MSQSGKSTPKMRRSYTPRVKSAQIVDDHSFQKGFFTNQKNSHNKQLNPQHVQNHIAKKLNLNSLDANQASNHKQFDIAVLNTDTDSPTKKINNFIQHQKQKDMQRQKQPINIKERFIQWPKENNNNRYEAPQNGQKHQLNRQRCISATTLKSTYTSYSQKTNKIKQSKKQFEEKFNVAFDYLLRSNSSYLNQKLSMCNQKSRPKEEIFKVQRPSINTTNTDLYKKKQDKHKLDIEPQNQKMSLLLSHSKVCGNSTTQEFHSGREGGKEKKAEWSQGFKLKGPIYSVTTKQNAYPNHGDFQKMVPIAVFNQHPLGLRHKQTSSNSKFYKGEYCPRSDLATWNNLNPVANDLFNPSKSTIYGKEFQKKQKQPIQTWPMEEHKLIISDRFYNTQFTSNLVNPQNHQLNDQNRCNCGRKRH